MAVDMIPVASSNIGEIGYDTDAGELHVRFLSGRTYVYVGVPLPIFDELMVAPSKGSFLNRAVKGIFDYHEI